MSRRRLTCDGECLGGGVAPVDREAGIRAQLEAGVTAEGLIPQSIFNTFMI